MNAIAGIGHNNPPKDDDEEAEDKSPPTPEEARIVYATIGYVRFKRPELASDFIEKKKGKVKLGWRLIVANLCKDRVRQNSLSQLLHYNRKTMGENQQRADVWAAMDPEFDEGLSALRAAVIADGFVDAELIETKVKHYVRIDPDLQRKEAEQRAEEAAALEAEKAVAAMEAKRAERQRAKSATGVKKALKGARNADAILAEHMGPRALVKRLSKEALAVIETLSKKAAKSVHPKASALNAAGLKECIKYGLARDAEPHLSKAEDRQLGPTALGSLVYLEGINQGLIAKPKRKKKDDD